MEELNGQMRESAAETEAETVQATEQLVAATERRLAEER